jgi:hypothetical protein
VSSSFTTNLQPLSVLTSNTGLSYSTFLSDLTKTSQLHSHTAATTGTSFSPESTNSNSFSFPWSGLSLNSSFDSVNQPEPRVSSPVQAHLQVSLPPENGSSVRTNFENILPGQVIPENPPSIERMNKKIESLSGKIDTVLLNQQIIIDCLKTNELLFNQTLRSETPVPTADSVIRTDLSHSTKEPQHSIVDGSELTMEELEKMKQAKKRGTTDAHFAVMLLKVYTTPDDRVNCTVHREGPKSKGLSSQILTKIRKGYELMYSQESWKDAVSAMNSHMRKYCSKKK